MKINRLEIKATIPTRAYENIQPCIELGDVELVEGTKYAEGFIRDFITRYSEHGPLKKKVIVRKKILKQSFNEDAEVAFEPIEHTYHHKSKELISATTFIKRFYKEFNNEAVSKNASKAWGVNQKDVSDLWESNGSLTALFGTLVHSALEHYEKYKALGDAVSKHKELEENYALPKHPILKNLIEGFKLINSFEGAVATEALITDIESGFCGLADRILITGEKKCRIQDYKINIGSADIDKNLKPLAPFDTLPANKLTKYQLQMSFYANMLQKSGWEVEGLDAFVYEDSWVHYPMGVLKVI